MTVKDCLYTLFKKHVKWSQDTFGPWHSPIGCLNHMELEVKEALKKPHDLTEYADICLLLFDAVNRAGFSYSEFVESVKNKIEVNKKREWVVSDDKDTPNLHKKGGKNDK